MADNTSLRQRATEAESEAAHAGEDLQQAMASNTEQEELIKQLEEDLQQRQVLCVHPLVPGSGWRPCRCSPPAVPLQHRSPEQRPGA